MHIEEFISKSFDEGRSNETSDNDNSNDSSPQAKLEKKLSNYTEKEEPTQLISIREFFSSSNNEYDQQTMDELNFKSFIN